jgi:hypothetical protein
VSPRRPSNEALGLTREDLRFLRDMLKSCCEICGERAELHVDHLHGTDVFRGLLCFQCNTALGKLRDDPAVLASALLYLLERGNEPGRTDEAVEAALDGALRRFGLSAPDALHTLEQVEVRRRNSLEEARMMLQRLEAEREKLDNLKRESTREAFRRLGLD